MRNLTTLAAVLVILASTPVSAQEYQTPPQQIMDLALQARHPEVFFGNDDNTMVYVYREPYRDIEELCEPELRLAGLRVNPVLNITANTRYDNEIKLQDIGSQQLMDISGMPDNAKISNRTFSPDRTKLAFTNTTSKGVELWYIDLAARTAHKITQDNLNSNIGRAFTWLPSSDGFIVKILPKDRPALINTDKYIPKGPAVSVSEPGIEAQNWTFQDLLQNQTDEFNFDVIATSELYRIDLNGSMVLIKNDGRYTSVTPSPDGKLMLLYELKRPYSYMVTYHRFPMDITVCDLDGKVVKVIEERPLIEALPKGTNSTHKGKRDIGWRNDKPATIYWVEALDGGDPANKVDYRDVLKELEYPFDGTPRELMKTINRFSGVVWGNDKYAVASDNWRANRNTKSYLFSPADPSKEPFVISDRNSQDKYSDPGSFKTISNQYNRPVMLIDKNKAYLVGDGYSREGKFPFINEVNLDTGKTITLYRASDPDIHVDKIDIKDIKKGEVILRMQSRSEYPNYYLLNIKKRIAPLQLTHFGNLYPSVEGMHRELVKYTRNDGVELSGELFLPPGYDMEKKEKLPLLMWAYPLEYKDRNSAGQSTLTTNTYPSVFGYGSPVFWVTRGFAVLNNAAFPIVGEGEQEPNDTFIEQLEANARAAIDALDELGYIDRNRVAVGGHSYGAFMTANLLTHTDLFAAGIARSGAYNRTLTPFGFQGEHRTYWEASDVYTRMSPFMNADKMRTPILLIHGQDDANTGTYPMQSERYFNALKGMGAPARLVILPKEDHGYSAKESILHVLWETDNWLMEHVMNKK